MMMLIAVMTAIVVLEAIYQRHHHQALAISPRWVMFDLVGAVTIDERCALQDGDLRAERVALQ